MNKEQIKLAAINFASLLEPHERPNAVISFLTGVMSTGGMIRNNHIIKWCVELTLELVPPKEKAQYLHIIKAAEEKIKQVPKASHFSHWLDDDISNHVFLYFHKMVVQNLEANLTSDMLELGESCIHIDRSEFVAVAKSLYLVAQEIEQEWKENGKRDSNSKNR